MTLVRFTRTLSTRAVIAALPKRIQGSGFFVCEDSNAAEARRTDSLGNALSTAIQSAPRLFDRHEEKISVDGHIALASRTYHRCDDASFCRILNRIHCEAIEISHDRVIMRKSQI